MLPLMTKVKVVSDLLNLELPVGKEAYIIAHNRRVDVAFKYLIRVPSAKKNFWVVEEDIQLFNEAEPSEDYSKDAEEVIIDVALKTKQFDIIRQLKDSK